MTLLISHIPKTAGSSLRALVERHSPDAVWVYDGELSLSDPDQDFTQAFKASAAPSVVMGHFSYGAHDLLGISPEYVTVLRDPFERIVSLFRYFRQREAAERGQRSVTASTLREFVESNLTEQTNNHACRIIAGLPADGTSVVGERWLLDRALANIRADYRLIGTVACLDRFLQRLSSLLDWPQVEMPLRNVSQGPAFELSGAEREAIRQKNALDVELYEIIRDRELGSAPLPCSSE